MSYNRVNNNVWIELKKEQNVIFSYLARQIFTNPTSNKEELVEKIDSNPTKLGEVDNSE